MEKQQKKHAEGIALSLSEQYHREEQTWNTEYIHGIGMYALNEGYMIKVLDRDGNVMWDATNHEMEMCSQIMNMISNRMNQMRPDLEGEFVTYSKDISQENEFIGTIEISYYSPYFLNDNDFRFLEALNKISAVVGVTSMIGAIFMGILLANELTKPIAKTVKITEQIAQGDYTIRFQEGVKTKELYDLSCAVNQMAESLEQQEAIRKSLTSDVAHELRTPLANISSYLEAIMEGVWEPTPERLKSCYDEINRISGMVSDLEKLRQIESENLKLEQANGDIVELINNVCQQFDKQIEEKQLTCKINGEPTFLHFDRNRMQQVFTNLVSNAVKYSDVEGKIKILIEQDENQVKISISDDGIGIAKEEQNLIFERFYRVEKSRNRKTGGAGIGLTIAKAIVYAHGGRLMVNSELGRGSTFMIVLPVR